MVLLSDDLMSCCAAGKKGCFDLRRRASALDERVSAEWTRCPGSMAQRAGLVRDGAALLRRNSADWMSAMIGRLSAGVGRRHPVAIRQALLIACSSVGMLKVNKTGEAGTPQGGRPEVILDNMTSSNRVHLAWLYIYSPVVIYFARKSIFHL